MARAGIMAWSEKSADVPGRGAGASLRLPQSAVAQVGADFLAEAAGLPAVEHGAGGGAGEQRGERERGPARAGREPILNWAISSIPTSSGGCLLLTLTPKC